MSKVCPVCKTEKDDSAFYVRRISKKTGNPILYSPCKECFNRYKRERKSEKKTACLVSEGKRVYSFDTVTPGRYRIEKFVLGKFVCF